MPFGRARPIRAQGDALALAREAFSSTNDVRRGHRRARPRARAALRDLVHRVAAALLPPRLAPPARLGRPELLARCRVAPGDPDDAGGAGRPAGRARRREPEPCSSRSCRWPWSPGSGGSRPGCSCSARSAARVLAPTGVITSLVPDRVRGLGGGLDAEGGDEQRGAVRILRRRLGARDMVLGRRDLRRARDVCRRCPRRRHRSGRAVDQRRRHAQAHPRCSPGPPTSRTAPDASGMRSSTPTSDEGARHGE